MSDKHIFEIKTEHAQPIKTLFEVLKEVLEDVNLELKRDDTNADNTKESESEYSSDSNSEDESDSENESEDESDNNSSVDGDNNSEDESESESDSASDSDSDDEKKSTNDNDNEKNNEELKKRGYIRTMAVDPTKSIFIHLKLDSKNFTKFRCKPPKKIIGVNLMHFHKLIKSMDKDDNLTLFLKSTDNDNLWIKRYNAIRKKETIDNMCLIDLNKEKYNIPPTRFEAVVKMQSSEFHKVCREMSNIGDFVEIQCINNKIIFKCKGDYTGRTVTYTDNQKTDSDSDSDADEKSKGCVCIKHSPEDPSNLNIVKEIYDLRNITLFNKFTSLCPAVQLYMKNDYPLIVKYTVATLGHILVCFTPVKSDEYKFENEYKLYKDKPKEKYL